MTLGLLSGTMTAGMGEIFTMPFTTTMNDPNYNPSSLNNQLTLAEINSLDPMSLFQTTLAIPTVGLNVDMTLQVAVEVEGLQVADEALLAALEVEFVFLNGLTQALEALHEALRFLGGGHGVAPVQILDPANGRGRALGHIHQQHGNDGFAEFEGLGDLVEAVAVRPADRMRGHGEHDPVALDEAVFDTMFPVAGAETLVVEPDFVAALTEGVAQGRDLLDQLIVAVAEEQFERFVGAPQTRALRRLGASAPAGSCRVRTKLKLAFRAVMAPPFFAEGGWVGALGAGDGVHVDRFSVSGLVPMRRRIQKHPPSCDPSGATGSGGTADCVSQVAGCFPEAKNLREATRFDPQVGGADPSGANVGWSMLVGRRILGASGLAGDCEC